MPTKTKVSAAEALMQEECEMGVKVAGLEAELAELETPSRPLTWQEIEAGAIEDLDRRERRRAILPRLIAAGKIRLLQLRLERLGAEIPPLEEREEETRAKLEEARSKRLEAQEREGRAASAYSDAGMALRLTQQESRQTARDLKALGAER